MSTEDEEVGWVLDGILNLLRGPVWCVPILTFIEHKSVTFEPKSEDKEEEEAEEGEEEEEEEGNEDHKGIHQEYKTLVDFLLQSFMDDLQVTPEQLEKACGMAAITTPFQRSLLEQVWAADDYHTFRNMMIQKNIELQLQALEMLQRKYGIVPESYKKEEDEEDESEKREREIMEEVYRISVEEHEAMAEAMDQEMRDLEEAIARSTQDERERLDRALRRPKREEGEEQEEEAEEEEEEEEEEPKTEEFSRMPVLPPISSKGSGIDPEDLRRRQEYLKSQRDKLLQMKQKEREKQLQDFEENDNKRPQSATAARRALDGGLDAKTLAVRRALAERLKAEVIKEV
ncbi:cilia- and flagella-associated protein 36-like [Scylla paramamosain]|uniref:cilia- and flagella-associated protein 36-like n=1 Tax=Scylla paramamosain TaxID=85552 RepID=UPI003082BF2D